MRDFAASARARILALSHESGRPFQQLLLRYACERFLYRLSVSEHRDSCVLKGASLLGLWMADPYRSTRDLDLLSFWPSDAQSVKECVASILAIPYQEDGLAFEADSLVVEPIREGAGFLGQRAKFDALIAQARLRVQIDFGFGDAVDSVEGDYPVILEGLEAPRLLVYTREYVVAEKFEAMLELGRGNSRMKDFHDLWALSRGFSFELPALASAFARCLEGRGRSLDSNLPEPLRPAFYEDEGLQSRWDSYRVKGSFQAPPPSAFSVVGTALGEFLAPVRSAIVAGKSPELQWLPGGPWK